jgi:hypothetical protein
MTTVDQNRKKFSRNTLKEDPSLKNLNDLQDCALYYILQNKLLSDLYFWIILINKVSSRTTTL